MDRSWKKKKGNLPALGKGGKPERRNSPLLHEFKTYAWDTMTKDQGVVLQLLEE